MDLPIDPTISGARIRYTAIVNAIAEAIEKGALKEGDRLPPQRDLAFRFGVAVGTVTRAYAELRQRGLVSGEVGRGTYVSRLRPVPSAQTATDPGRGRIDFTINRPPSEGSRREFAKTLAYLSKRSDLSNFLGHQTSAGQPMHRAAGAAWVARTGWKVEPERVVLSNGVQHGLAVVFAALARPGDLVLTEELNYPGIRLLEQVYQLRLRGVAIDREGMNPAALEVECRQERARFLVCTPTVHNPTSTLMPQSRRRRIAEIAANCGLVIIENDIYGPMPPEPVLPLSALLPDSSYYISGASKCIAAGLRVGYIVAPRASVPDIVTAVQATTWMPSPLLAEIMAIWDRDGTTTRIIEWHREEASARQTIAKRVMADALFEAHPVGYHLWLKLPEPWRQQEFVSEARNAQVLVSPSETFVIGRATAPHAVRISLGGDISRDDVERGLTLLADILTRGPRLKQVIV